MLRQRAARDGRTRRFHRQVLADAKLFRGTPRGGTPKRTHEDVAPKESTLKAGTLDIDCADKIVENGGKRQEDPDNWELGGGGIFEHRILVLIAVAVRDTPAFQFQLALLSIVLDLEEVMGRDDIGSPWERLDISFFIAAPVIFLLL